jgi:hypothetical protein
MSKLEPGLDHNRFADLIREEALFASLQQRAFRGEL